MPFLLALSFKRHAGTLAELPTASISATLCVVTLT